MTMPPPSWGRAGSKRALLDNKYAFHDEGLLKWFAQDEAKRMHAAGAGAG